MRIILYHEVKGRFVCTMPRLDTKKNKDIFGSPTQAQHNKQRQITTWGYLSSTL